jgi:hypothetical protein
MNKEQAVEIMAIFLENANLETARARGTFNEEELANIAAGSLRNMFLLRASGLYDHMSEQGLIVKD